MLVEFLSEKSEEFSRRGPTALGYMHAYAKMTHAEMLAILVHEGDQVYEILFSFTDPSDEDEFLRLLQANETTACDPDNIVVPPEEHIAETLPLEKVLPPEVMREILIVSAMALPVSPTSRPN